MFAVAPKRQKNQALIPGVGYNPRFVSENRGTTPRGSGSDCLSHIDFNFDGWVVHCFRLFIREWG